MNEDKIRKRWYGGADVGFFTKLAAAVFAKLVAFRRKLYAIGLLKSHKLKVPIIVVGNITAGGGGKTPLVIWLVEQLQQAGYKPGIISRGYGGKRKVEPMFVTANANPAATGDEPLLMAKKTKLPVMVGKDRVKAAKSLIQNYSVNVIVADDGMQHYAMQRDAEIVMLDAKWRTGNHLMIPAGPLREPLERLNEVDLVVFKGVVEQQHHYEFTIDQIHQLNHPSVTKEITEFRNKKVVAMAGIANPDSFFSMLSAAGMAIIKYPLPDHHDIKATDFDPHKDTTVLITEKDAVKCEDMKLDNVWVVTMRVVVPEKTQAAVKDLIQKVMQ
ncbi:tetraacyldisaccharide 4'-kinase [Marinicella sp. S1101]|uniref:tetraacyldisaccharide 4'-kinase n=1 Tax=Marinicella marina TaxID=2996016 RepID=UPI002260F476|nr:tetraacyldisaccharide 4'-kinase [Marinicella marina]MCX7554728.1 tetraacyldisaccharide 4'-kinase [Marinicella marina]MDJ1141456.1 tetraacyldisaccharide 4'-kinase [Marinicella marina]